METQGGDASAPIPLVLMVGLRQPYEMLLAVSNGDPEGFAFKLYIVLGRHLILW